MSLPIIRVTTAGSVDDGKSTVLAQILIESGLVHGDLITEAASGNFANLLDGLASEREQGITIDVAHRFADLEGQRFHFADSPGHVEYTRNMATACAGSHTLLLVVDVVRGPREQTLRHLEIAIRLGVQKLVIAINKMDLVGYDQTRFEEVSREILSRIETLTSTSAACPSIEIIPVSGLRAENIVTASGKMSWFKGPTAIAALRAEPPFRDDNLGADAIIQVQLVQRSRDGRRRYLGPLLQGTVEVGQELWTGTRKVRVEDLYVNGRSQQDASAGDQISIAINIDVDLSRGEVLSSSKWVLTDQLDVTLIWLSTSRLWRNKTFTLKSGSASTSATIINLNAMDLTGADKFYEADQNESGWVVQANIRSSRPIYLRKFLHSHELASFVLVDPVNGQTVAVGTVGNTVQQEVDITRQDFGINADSLSKLTGNDPKVIWFTGLSGSGKSTLADRLSQELYLRGRPHCVLDGDNLRFGLNKDLGFSEEDRTENIRRTAEVAKLMCDAGLIVLVCLISPSSEDRNMARAIVGEARFKLVFVNTPLEVCQLRDPKGLYKRALAGELQNFTGVSAPYQIPVGAIEVTTEVEPDTRQLAKMLGLE